MLRGGELGIKKKALGWQESHPRRVAKVIARATVVGRHTLSGLFRRFSLFWSADWPKVQLGLMVLAVGGCPAPEQQSGDLSDTTCFLRYRFKIPKCSFFLNRQERHSCRTREVRDCLGPGRGPRGWDAKVWPWSVPRIPSIHTWLLEMWRARWRDWMLAFSQYEFTLFENWSTMGYFSFKHEPAVLGGVGFKATFIKMVTSEGGVSAGPGARLWSAPCWQREGWMEAILFSTLLSTLRMHLNILYSYSDNYINHAW